MDHRASRFLVEPNMYPADSKFKVAILLRRSLAKSLVFFVLILLPALAAAQGKVIHVKDPGDGNSIHTNLEAAFARAGTGDTIQLPAGEFTVEDGTNHTIYLQDTDKDNIYIRGKGSGAGGTKLKRGKVVEVDAMVDFRLANHIEISDICFEGPKRRL